MGNVQEWAAEKAGTTVVAPNPAAILSPGALNKRVAFSLSALPAVVAAELGFLDTDGSGEVDIAEIRHAATVFHESKRSMARMRRWALVGAFAFLAISLSQFGVMWAAITMARQVRVAQ
jgi:hypothetical protein